MVMEIAVHLTSLINDFNTKNNAEYFYIRHHLF